MGGRTNRKSPPAGADLANGHGPDDVNRLGDDDIRAQSRDGHSHIEGQRQDNPDDLTVLRMWMRAIIADVEAKLVRAGYAANAWRMYQADLSVRDVDHMLLARRDVLGDNYENESHSAARAAATAARLLEILEGPNPEPGAIFAAGRELYEYDKTGSLRDLGRRRGGQARAASRAAEHGERCAEDRVEYQRRVVEAFRAGGYAVDRAAELDEVSENVVAALVAERGIGAAAMKDRIGYDGGMRAAKRAARAEIERRRGELLAGRVRKSPAIGALAVEPGHK